MDSWWPSLAGTKFKNTQTNDKNMSYYGPIWMGTPLQKLDGIVYDTGSGKLLVESSECSNCNGTKFQVAPTSSTFQWDAVNTAQAGT